MRMVISNALPVALYNIINSSVSLCGRRGTQVETVILDGVGSAGFGTRQNLDACHCFVRAQIKHKRMGDLSCLEVCQ